MDPKVEELLRTTGEVKKVLKALVEHPEIMDDWSQAEMAWMKEHLEMILEESKRIQADIREALAKRTG